MSVFFVKCSWDKINCVINHDQYLFTPSEML